MIRTKDMLQEEYDREKEADRVLRFRIQESLIKQRYYYEESKGNKERTIPQTGTTGS